MLRKFNEENIQVMLIEVLKMMGLTLAPVFAAAVVAGVLANIMQVGFMFINGIHSI